MVHTRTPEGGGWPSFLSHRARVWFDQAGWTSSEWNVLYGTITRMDDPNPPVRAAQSQVDGRQGLLEWLRDPPDTQLVISPAAVMDAFGAFGAQTPEALNAYAAGASTGFVAAFLTAHPTWDPEQAWTILHSEMGLPEVEATGWALTRYQFTRGSVTSPFVNGWRDQCGPSAYLWVLAGFTLGEATTVQENAGTSEQQLRVMAALSVGALPVGT